MGRIVPQLTLAAFALALPLAEAAADPVEVSDRLQTLAAEVETERERREDADDVTRVYLAVGDQRIEVTDLATAETLARFRREDVRVRARVRPGAPDGLVAAEVEVVDPVYRDDLEGVVRHDPDYAPIPRLALGDAPAGAEPLRVFGRTYRAIKLAFDRRIRARGWVFHDAQGRPTQVCLDDIEARALERTVLTRALVAVQGWVDEGDLVRVRNKSLFGLQVMVEGPDGSVGYLLPEQIAIGEPAEEEDPAGPRRGLADMVPGD